MYSVWKKFIKSYKEKVVFLMDPEQWGRKVDWRRWREY
jgi:hypothetical protein